MDDSRRSHLPCLLIDFLASLPRDPLNGWPMLWEKRVISDLLFWKWERRKGQAKWTLRKVVHAGGCVVAGWQITPCPHPQHAVTSLEFMCPVSWAPPRSKKVKQTMLPLSERRGKSYGIYGRLRTQLLFPTSPWQQTQSHWNPVLKGWEWARVQRIKPPCAWRFLAADSSLL